jgi:hypothetical protein
VRDASSRLDISANLRLRYSNHPAVARPDLEQSEYGEVFLENSLALLEAVKTSPSRDSAAGCILLTWACFGKGERRDSHHPSMNAFGLTI